MPNILLPDRSTAAARAAAVQALVATAVPHHDAAALGAAGGVLLDLECHVRRAQRQRHRASGLAVSVAVGGVAVGGVAVGGVAVGTAVDCEDVEFRRGRG